MNEFWAGFVTGVIAEAVLLVVFIWLASRRHEPELPGGREDWFV